MKSKLSSSEIRLVNDWQDSGRTFIHTFDGRTFQFMVPSRLVYYGHLIRNRFSDDLYKRWICKLFSIYFKTASACKAEEIGRKSRY